MTPEAVENKNKKKLILLKLKEKKTMWTWNTLSFHVSSNDLEDTESFNSFLISETLSNRTELLYDLMK